ncbi:MAG: YdjY domain-containing protein [Desulfuromonadaceae bacterium]|nr:YdjY domain-containing protein [Desulfuromonadaceae bacterium]MDD2855893.1 YdjY domain-containing protein [Desulfuromonadaceae bacterium]
MNTICRALVAASFSFLTMTAGVIEAREIPVPPAGNLIPAPPVYNSPAIEKLGDGKYRIGEILINKQDKSVTFPAVVNMNSGILEYLLVNNVGKTHESLLRTGISPYNLQVAFMLLGYEGTNKRLSSQGSPELPKGESVNIMLSNVAEKQTVPFPVESWLVNKTGSSTIDVNQLNWVFCGSYVNELGGFMSQESGSIVAIWHDPVAMIDNASPGGESNRIWYVKEGTVPAVGTKVTVTVMLAK